ncbi:MAG: hypothetical protein HQL93_05365 [Magnetococcales bacterium]|nr:hypothetical protein [Magnetococcales bacterium]
MDFGSYTCEEFLQEVATSNREDIGAILLWLDGYLSGVTGDTVLNWKNFESFAESLADRCNERRGEKLLRAVRKTGAK